MFAAPRIAELRDARAFRGPAECAPDQPLVSVVIPTYQSAAFLDAALASVRAQDHPQVELIVIDGGSTDGTLDILSRYRAALGYFHSGADHGPYDAMNRGIAMARGALIKIHNSDDVMPPDSVSAAVECFLAEGGRPCVVRGALGCIDRGGALLGDAGTRARIPWLPRIAHPTWYVASAVYERHGLYATEFRIAADTEMYFRLQRAGVPFIESPRVLSQFRSGGRSSGLRGVVESFRINQAYLGLGPASVVGALTAAVKTPRVLLGSRLESSALRRVRQWSRQQLWR